MAEVRLDVSFEGLDGVQERLDRVQFAIEPPGLTEHLSVGADVFVMMMRTTVPKGETLELMESIDKHEREDGWDIYPHTIYARIQDQGGENHPDTAPFMAFEYRGASYHALTVHIPATHYVEDAFDMGEELAAESVKQSIKQAIE